MAGRKRLDPSTSDAPSVRAIVTTATRDRIAGIAAAKGISLSAAARELLESALACLDEAKAG